MKIKNKKKKNKKQMKCKNKCLKMMKKNDIKYFYHKYINIFCIYKNTECKTIKNILFN